jgi:hypothetical protein
MDDITARVAETVARFKLVHDPDPSYRSQMLQRADGQYVRLADYEAVAAELAEARTVQGAAEVLLEAGADVHLGNAIQAQAMPDEVGGRQDREVFRLVANEALRTLAKGDAQ